MVEFNKLKDVGDITDSNCYFHPLGCNNHDNYLRDDGLRISNSSDSYRHNMYNFVLQLILSELFGKINIIDLEKHKTY
jgi:hypothetical protein